MKKTLLALFIFSSITPAFAKEVTITAEATVSAVGTPQSIQALAKNQAKLEAVKNAIIKMLGPDSLKDPAISGKIQLISSQITNDHIISSEGTLMGSSYVQSITLALDDKEFRTLLIDNGMAANTSTTRSYAILAVMDEFFTTPTDLKAPLEELQEFSHKKGNSFKDKTVSAKSAKSANASASSEASSVDARSSANAKSSGSHDTRIDAKGETSARGSASDGYGSANFAGSRSESISGRDKGQYSGEASSAASYKAAQGKSSSDASAQSDSSISAKNVSSEQHDDIHYKKLVKYQPHNRGPEKTSKTYNALKGQLEEYDIKVIDNDIFRSRYFKNKPITIEQLEDSSQLNSYVAFARKEANADFFMVGNAIIIDSGKNPATDQWICTGVMSIKTYATASGEDIASETTSEESVGEHGPDQCAANLAKKLADIGGSIISSRIQEFWKRRNTYGKEYILTLKGSSVPLMVRTAFSKAVQATPGVVRSIQRSASETEYQIVVTYKGTEPIDQAVAMNLATNPVFASLDSKADGDQITMCMANCSSLLGQANGSKQLTNTKKKK